MIPKIIHQTWKTDAVPPEWTGLVRSWKCHHPDWEHRLWTDADNRGLVEAHYPDLLAGYDAFPYGIQRADVARCCILHRFGGVYVDLDIECLRPIDSLLGDHPTVLIHEPPIHSRLMGRDTTISNAFMAARPNDPLFTEILHDVAVPRKTVTHADVLQTTGPLAVDRIYRRVARPDIVVLDHRTVFPFPAQSDELKILAEASRDALELKLACIVDGAHAIHYWANSWAHMGADGLVNPEPYSIEEFVFFPRYDSFGYDICNRGREVAVLAHACLSHEACMAFNTDGFLKHRLRPKRRWQHHADKAWNEGLYVKRTVLARPWVAILGTGRRKPAG